LDWDNLALVQEECPPQHQAKVLRLTELCVENDATVLPDPCCGGSSVFDKVLNLVEDACDGLIKHIQRQSQRQSNECTSNRYCWYPSGRCQAPFPLPFMPEAMMAIRPLPLWLSVNSKVQRATL